MIPGIRPKGTYICTYMAADDAKLGDKLSTHLLDLDVHRVDLSRAVVACHDGEPYRLVYPHRIPFSLEAYRHAGWQSR